MSKYTTGEIAKLCHVTVRTVQYYDSRNILSPSEFSEGGRRLYSEDDVRKLKIICFLRSIDLPLNNIAALFSDKNFEEIILLTLKQQETTLLEEIQERQLKLQTLGILKKELKSIQHSSVESIGDIAYKMENRRKLFRLRLLLLGVGIPLNIMEVISLILWIVKGIWLPFIIWLFLILSLGILITHYYFKHVAYICPQCHAVFSLALKQALFARHTPNLRKLTCTSCGHHGFCIETYNVSTKKHPK